VGLFVCVCVFVGGSVTACIDPYHTWSVGEGSDRLQLIKFWPSRAPGEGVRGGTKIVSTLLQPVRSVCFSPSVFLSFNYCIML